MLPRLASLILNQVHFITPDAAQAVMGALDGRIGDLDLEAVRGVSANAFVGDPVFDTRTGDYKGYRMTAGGVAIVPIRGELVNRGAWVGARSGLTSYEGLRHTMRMVAEDKRAKSVVLDVDSPGGMVPGAFETAAVIREVAQSKPVTAVANPMMASAAYLISSGASKIVATDGAIVGHIGALIIHTDRSGEMANKGQKVTYIHAGRHKVDGNSSMPLPDAVRLDIQARVDKAYGQLVDAVAINRGMDVATIRGTEARYYVGDDAVAQGLADTTATFDHAVADAEAGKVGIRKASRTQTQPGQSPKPQNDNAPAKEAARMQNEQGGPAANTSGGLFEGMSAGEMERLTTILTASLAQAAQPKATTEPVQPQAKTDPEKPGESADASHARGRSEERARISAILNHAEAKDRPIQARVLALDSDVSAEKAGAMLAQMPKDAVAGKNGAEFYAAMNRVGGNPQVRAGHGNDGGDGSEKAGSLLMGSMNKLIGQNKPSVAQQR